MRRPFNVIGGLLSSPGVIKNLKNELDFNTRVLSKVEGRSIENEVRINDLEIKFKSLQQDYVKALSKLDTLVNISLCMGAGSLLLTIIAIIVYAVTRF